MVSRERHRAGSRRAATALPNLPAYMDRAVFCHFHSTFGPDTHVPQDFTGRTMSQVVFHQLLNHLNHCPVVVVKGTEHETLLL